MFQKGQRVRLISTDDPYARLRYGDEGVVTSVDTVPDYSSNPRFPSALPRQITQVWIKWDSGSRLAMLPMNGDRIEVVS